MATATHKILDVSEIIIIIVSYCCCRRPFISLKILFGKCSNINTDKDCILSKPMYVLEIKNNLSSAKDIHCHVCSVINLCSSM